MEDPYLWLEEILGERALTWVRAENATTRAEVEQLPWYEPTRRRLLSALDSKEQIPAVSKLGPSFYNFWRDADHPRGLWRRTTLAEYEKPQPVWETVLDLDALAKEEAKNWVWKGATCVQPEYDRCLLLLSDGGADATTVREFDLTAKQFVPDGFTLPSAKNYAYWRHRDSLLVGTDFGPGTLTNSGYPRIVKQWDRGTPLSSATTVFAGEPGDVSVSGWSTIDHGHRYEFIRRGLTTFEEIVFLRRDGKLVELEIPHDAGFDTWADQLLVMPRSAWTVAGKTYAAGTALAIDFAAFLAGSRDFETLFAPGPRGSLGGMTATKTTLIINELDNMRSRITVWRRSGGRWSSSPLSPPALETVQVAGIDSDENDDFFLSGEGPLTPSSLFIGNAGGGEIRRLKSLPAFFDATGLVVEQHEATSADGTKVPYFQVSRLGLPLDGTHPTVLYGYGGFLLAQQPIYRPIVGISWLEAGGVWVLANIRGGGEFGPNWHRAALKENRQRAFDDFIAVAEDLIARKVTASAHLAVHGGSNGGLLVGAVVTQRPELFKAAVCEVPLLDMRRYNKLLAGASWMGEYGDPDKPEEWSYISRYSPYQNVRSGKRYPRILFATSTRDDRVHPGHARKMVAKMKAQGHDVLYYENIEGGHAGAANNEQLAIMRAMEYSFLRQELGLGTSERRAAAR